MQEEFLLQPQSHWINDSHRHGVTDRACQSPASWRMSEEIHRDGSHIHTRVGILCTEDHLGYERKSMSLPSSCPV